MRNRHALSSAVLLVSCHDPCRLRRRCPGRAKLCVAERALVLAVRNQLIEEYWLPPNAELALGVGRTLKAGKTVTFEFMRIETRDGVTDYLAMHDGKPAVAFRLTASGSDWARFENPQHDFPKRVEYRRTPAGLHAEIAGPGKDGKEIVLPFDYRRCVD